MYKRAVLLFVINCLSLSLFAGEIDSLTTAYQNCRNDSMKAFLALNLCDKIGRNEYFKAKNYATEALEYFKKSNNPKGEGLAYGHLGFVHFYNSAFDEAINAYISASKIFSENNLLIESIDILNKIGVLYFRLKNYEKALHYYEEVLALYQKGEEDKTGKAYVLNNIGLVYERLKNYDKSLTFYQQSLEIKEAINDLQGTASSTNNIGNIHYFKQNYEIAIRYWEKSLKIKKQLNDMPGISSTLGNIAQGYFDMGDNTKAIEFAKSSLEIAKKANNKYQMQSAYDLLATLNASTKDYKQAYENHMLYSELKDSIFTENSSRQIAEMETKYKTEKKEKEIEIQNLQISEQSAEIKNQRITIFASVGGAILLLAFALVTIRAYRQKQKANILLANQKKEIEIQKNIIQEKNRDITDSIAYARHIQQALLPEMEKIKEALPESFVLYMPKDIVSGDFYWMHSSSRGSGVRSSEKVKSLELEKNSEQILFACCDCTGHGVPGAFMSMIGSNTLTKIVAEHKITQPSEILNRLNGDIKTALKQKSDYGSSKDGMDIALVQITNDCQFTKMQKDTNNSDDLKFRKLEKDSLSVQLDYAGANRSLIYFENDEMKEISPDKTAIGGYTDDCYLFNNHTLHLPKSSMLYIFSDGYADQFGGSKGKKFMLRNLKALFGTIKNLPADKQEKTLREVFEVWKGERDQVDDVLVIGVRV